jgi:hypothetical protein
MSAATDDRALPLLVEEYFNAEDERFVETLRQIHSPKFLAGFTDRWKKDPRPWARRQIFLYLQHPLDRPGHQPVIRRLFKNAEENKDDDLMAALMVVFDCVVRRTLQKKYRWDFESRTQYEEEKLVTPRNVLPRETTTTARNPFTGKPIIVTLRQPRGGRLFRYHTRYYLRRRAWRYFRRMGFQRAESYPAAVASALIRYQDADLAKGENILDSWSLLHICFGQSNALEFQASHVQLKDGRGLGDLSAAPQFPKAWRTPNGAEVLFSTVWQAQARLVRVWALQMFGQVRQTVAVDLQPDKLLKLLDHDDAEVQQFGAELLASATGMEKMPVSFWLQLLKTKNLTALQTICDVVSKHVSADRFDLAQCIELACATATPVARLGLGFLKARTVSTPADRALLARVANAKCSAAGRELAGWALAILGRRDGFSLDFVQPFFDSLLFEIRGGAWMWLMSPDCPAYNDPVLWSRLTETPFDDIRLKLVDHLERRSKLSSSSSTSVTSASPDPLVPVWSSVLLGVHRGGRQKLKAVRQIGAALTTDPSRTEQLLPVLAVAVRSVRRPEARAGLAAIVSALESRPELTDLVKKHLPELSL